MAANSSATPVGVPPKEDKGPEVPEWAKKAAVAAAGVAVVLLGVAAIKKARKDDSPEGKVENTAQKAKNKVKDIFGK